MFLREESERIGSFYLRDKSSARVEGSVMGLGHNDLKTLITKILLVGGTTRIPFVRQTLASLWGKAKFVPEGIVEPIQACSIGAAWQQQSLGTIVDRLPFSTIVKWDSGQVELYKAFTPTVDFKTLTTAPSINPFESKSFSLPHRKVSVIYKNPDGEIIKEVPLSLVPGSYALRIDLFGRCILTDGLSQYPLPNPYQHPEQKKMWEQLEDGKRQEAAAQREKIRKWLERRPGEDLREVG